MVGDGDQVQDNTGSSVAVSVALALGDDLGQVKGKGQTSRTRNKGQGTRDKDLALPCLALSCRSTSPLVYSPLHWTFVSLSLSLSSIPFPPFSLRIIPSGGAG